MDYKDLIMYAHGSAYNHGCEAIVRASADILSRGKSGNVIQQYFAKKRALAWLKYEVVTQEQR